MLTLYNKKAPKYKALLVISHLLIIVLLCINEVEKYLGYRTEKISCPKQLVKHRHKDTD